MHRQETWACTMFSSVVLCKEMWFEENNYNLIQPLFVCGKCVEKHVVKFWTCAHVYWWKWASLWERRLASSLVTCCKLKNFNLHPEPRVLLTAADWQVKISFSVQIGLNFHLFRLILNCDIVEFQHGHRFLCYRYLCHDNQHNNQHWHHHHPSSIIITIISNIIVILKHLIIRPKFCCHWSYFVDEDMLQAWSAHFYHKFNWKSASFQAT